MSTWTNVSLNKCPRTGLGSVQVLYKHRAQANHSIPFQTWGSQFWILRYLLEIPSRPCHHYLFSKKFIGTSFFWCIFMYLIQGKKWKIIFFCPTYLILAYKFAWTPFWGRHFFVSFIGFMVLKTTGLSSWFQCKNPFCKICTGSLYIG